MDGISKVDSPHCNLENCVNNLNNFQFISGACVHKNNHKRLHQRNGFESCTISSV